MSDGSTAPLIDYRGNCHCGAFKFTFKAPALKQAYACNCSFCSKNGYLWAFPATSEDFVVVKGDEDSTLKTYEFGKHTMAHKFCPTCGTSVMARKHSGPGVGINIRALVDVDTATLEVITSDGAATEPPYQIPEPLAAGPVAEGTTVYTGSCHCGAVGYNVQSPEPITVAAACNCSICHRDAAMWIYVKTTAVSFKGLDSLVEYTFGLKRTYHGFCGTCGVAINERFPTADREWRTALNIRTMNGVDLAAIDLELHDGKAKLPVYQV
ncbi:glutathione-dependent formaldehyde-activating enzyme [Mycena maculata]|uniref:Glutathione-dependent formaldehyde-activating enzyme n=1 Tax=Mycena maculata TaxID=230809 RepID=A0AAD7NQ94_9AGAR|nr:glutathione-dependent formaldehyde-activating enzyme [Mycena maculata]